MTSPWRDLNSDVFIILFPAGEIHRGGEEGGQSEPVLTPPRDGRDAAR